ncbi:MAG: hypothetical protein C0412_06830 [Flavobacterium sp.]|nr:hypothetical protein [Flavobacterium sp.]
MELYQFKGSFYHLQKPIYSQSVNSGVETIKRSRGMFFVRVFDPKIKALERVKLLDLFNYGKIITLSINGEEIIDDTIKLLKEQELIAEDKVIMDEKSLLEQPVMTEEFQQTILLSITEHPFRNIVSFLDEKDRSTVAQTCKLARRWINDYRALDSLSAICIDCLESNLEKILRAHPNLKDIELTNWALEDIDTLSVFGADKLESLTLRRFRTLPSIKYSRFWVIDERFYDYNFDHEQLLIAYRKHIFKRICLLRNLRYLETSFLSSSDIPFLKCLKKLDVINYRDN